MKICYICPKFYPREVPLYEYTQGLARHGCDVHVIAFRGEGELVSEKIDDVWVQRVIDDSTSRGDRFRPIFLRFLWQAYQLLSQTPDWDIVNVRNLPAASLLPIWARNQRTAWALEVQSPPLHESWRALFSKRRMRLESRAFARTLVHAQAVAYDIFGDHRPDIFELPIGVDFNHFTPGTAPALRAEYGFQPEDLLCLYSGVISPKRTLHKLIEAVQIARSSVPTLHLLFVGEGSDVARLQTLVATMNLTDAIHFLGYVPYEKMPAYMHMADIGLGYVPVVPWFDKAPVLKTMESLAAGLPTIATKTQGNRAYIQPGLNGLLVEDTPAAVAVAISQLARDEGLRQRLRNGREFIQRYNWQSIVDEVLYPIYLDLYRSKRAA